MTILGFQMIKSRIKKFSKCNEAEHTKIISLYLCPIATLENVSTFQEMEF